MYLINRESYTVVIFTDDGYYKLAPKIYLTPNIFVFPTADLFLCNLFVRNFEIRDSNSHKNGSWKLLYHTRTV